MRHDPGGFRLWWRQLTGSDATLDNAHVMRLAGRFGRRIRGYAKANDIPVVSCSAGERKHDIAEDYLARTTITQGLFLVLVGRAQAPVWDVSTNHRAPHNAAMVKARSEARAAARADRRCANPDCNKPLAAQRWTRRFCSTRCRVAVHRDQN